MFMFPITGCEDCECGCELFTDDFERADDTDLGVAWEEIEGDWSIDTGAVVSDSADGLLLTVAEQTARKVQIQVKLNLDTVDDVARVVLAEDADNYLFAQVRVREDLAFLRLGKVVAGTLTYLTNEAAQTEDRGEWGRGEEIILRLCYADGVLSANTFCPDVDSGFGQFADYTIALPASYRIGLGTGTQTGVIQFLEVAAGKCETCSRNCHVVDDDFNRATIGENWDSRSGVWSIDWTTPDITGLLTTSSADAVIVSESHLSQFPESLNDRAQVAQSSVVLYPGSSAMVLVAWESDNRYLFARYQLSGDGLTETLKLYSKTVFGVTQLGTTLTGRTYPPEAPEASVTNVLRVCYNGATLTGTLQAGGSVEASVSGFTGMQAGVGAYSSADDCEFSFFTYSILGTNNGYGDIFSAGNCPTCTPACAQCDTSDAAPVEMTVSVPAGWTDNACNCDAIAGDFVLRYNGACCWEYVQEEFCTFTECSTVNAVHYLKLRLCVVHSGGNHVWTLTIGIGLRSSVDPCSDIETVYTATVAYSDTGCNNPPASLALSATNQLTLAINGTTRCAGTAPAAVGLAV